MMQGSREGSVRKGENAACLHTHRGHSDNAWEWVMAGTESLSKLEGMGGKFICCRNRESSSM